MPGKDGAGRVGRNLYLADDAQARSALEEHKDGEVAIPAQLSRAQRKSTFPTENRGRVVMADIPCSLGGGRRGFNPRQPRRTKRAFFPP